jgi:FkbM family methyltransferase
MAAEFAKRSKAPRDPQSWLGQALKKTCLSLVPCNSSLIYRLAKRYVDAYNSENNSCIETNGELDFMQQYLPQCETVFDIGANIGQWTALALKINPNARVHCFEPSGNTFQRLLANRFPPNVVCNNFGMSSAPGEGELFVFDECNAMNSLYSREGLGGIRPSTRRREGIVLDTVDNYCLEHGIESIDLAKIDVEGHEIEVCKGMIRILKSGRIGAIQLEYGGCNIDAGVLLKDIFRFFEAFDYSFYKVYPKKLRFVPGYEQRLENFQYQNWAIIKKGILARGC